MVFFLLIGGWLNAADLEVTDVETVYNDYPEPERVYYLTVSWNHSWRNDKNHDAAWVILKSLKNQGYDHLPLLAGSAEMLWKDDPTMPDATIDVAEDGGGFFVHASENYRGPLKYRISVALDTAQLSRQEVSRAGVKGYGIEMVYIPKGPFTLGDPSEAARKRYSFYRSDDEGNYDGLYRIESEDETIPVGPEEGSLYYRSDQAIYRGDQQGPIPADFPKGVRAFYLMKYEISQGDYANFLNTLDRHGASVRYPGGMTDFEKFGNTLHIEDGAFVADRPEQRMNFMHWDDMMAFIDWAALRPYTEFEYTKAARGTGEPIAHEFPWGTDNHDRLARKINPATNFMEMQRSMTEADLNDENRPYFGASYYWVFDLSGGLWDKVVTIGDPTGRAFEGQHGDGKLNFAGYADVEGWPKGYQNAKGYGYRGGGHYGEPWISDFNPYSPIAFRNFASWSGGLRTKAYGGRAARTAD